MRFISVRGLRRKLAEIWKTLPSEGEMIVTRRGRPVAVLAAADEASLEEFLSAFRQARAVEVVASLQRRSVEQGMGRISIQDINAEVKEVRRKRS